MERQWDLMCGLSEQESSLKTPKRSGIDLTVATFASTAALPVKSLSDGPENSIGVLRRDQCGCRYPCNCNPCYCNGFAIGPNTVTLIASVAPTVMMPSEGSEKSVEAEREGIHPKLEKSIEAER